MTPEPDNVSRLIKRSVKGPLRFDENPQEVEPDQTVQVAIVVGRKVKVETPEGQVKVQGRARLIRTPKGLISIPGGEGASISVDDLGKLLNKESTLRVQSALHKDRERKKGKRQCK
ncbi:hypothetical protein COX03_03250 [Candidatus Woesebacteria bacterium CG22_combo_CG10-13_8_21_14_all_39_10]|uniref:Uncharacterized protein n=2 Tax=Candidatus Woeseibacteriota TaxID=1752722 RepID=A0A2H0BIC4_9BACT|nr:MAG: hypothetical protein COX03_03250 [Candidatus Woesebacteria bacterium CG22_combo_CG10-13_8_21_14_all_39_10]PIZ49312.1 MAG: hypothetical protein COY29_02045 [Candidatus Woesebacteria bacterium CG_4_10_14_0_2_um_filter_39_14]